MLFLCAGNLGSGLPIGLGGIPISETSPNSLGGARV